MPETTTAPYVTLCSDGVHDLPAHTRTELVEWLKGMAPDVGTVYRVTFDPHAEGTTTVFVTELVEDASSPFLARVRTLPRVPQPVLPDHLLQLFEPCADFL